MKKAKPGQCSPLISVIMGVYNCQETLDEAISSILNQTVSDWEFIICDDGSTDLTYQIADRYREKYPAKIKLLRNVSNEGLNATLNKCLRYTRGTYIARMDGDDICSPERFEIELETFSKERGIAIVSTDMTYFDEYGKWGKIVHPTYPTSNDFVKGTPFCHAPCMVKRDALLSVNGYSVSKMLLRVEDYHLWIKLYEKGYRGKNIHKALYQMRDDRNAYQRRKFRYRVNEAYVRCLAIKKLHLKPHLYMFALRPLLVGLLPYGIYNRLHKKRLNQNE